MKSDVNELLGDIEYAESIRNYQEAFDYYKSAIRSKPNNINLYIKMGKALEKLREFEEAITCFNKALRIDRNNFLAHYRLGLIYIRNN